MNPLCLLPFLCAFIPMQPAPLVPNGQGGWVPVTNSRYDPATGQFLPPEYSYPPSSPWPGQPWPEDHPWGEQSYSRGTVTVGPPEPYQPPPAPVSPPPRHHANKPVHRAPENGAGCYDSSGAPVSPVPPDCQPQPPLPERTL
jgi:hypothetical protein